MIAQRTRFGAFVVLSVVSLASALALMDCGSDDSNAHSDADGGTGLDGTTATDDAPSGEDAGPFVDAAPLDPCAVVAGCPKETEGAHLQVWLRGDVGVDCNGGHVTAWHDLSGHAGRMATLAQYADGGTAIGPECGSSITINGHNVVDFARPDPDAGGPHALRIDETMSIDLSFLAGTSYSILIVDAPVYRDGAFPGSSAPQGLLAADRTTTSTSCTTFCSGTCPPPPENDGTLDLVLNGNAASAADGGVATAAYNRSSVYCAGPYFNGTYDAYASPTLVHGVVFDTTDGHSIFVNGGSIFTGDKGPADLTAIADAGLSPGALGRDKNSYGDNRFQGRIAEVVIYDTALQETELTSLQQYFSATWSIR